MARREAVALLAAVVLLFHAGSTAFCVAPQSLSGGTQIRGLAASGVYASAVPAVPRGIESGQAMTRLPEGLAVMGLLCAVAVQCGAASSAKAATRPAVRRCKVTCFPTARPAARASAPVQHFSLMAMDDELPLYEAPNSLATVDLRPARAVRRKEAKKAKKARKAKAQKLPKPAGFTNGAPEDFLMKKSKRARAATMGTSSLMDAAYAGKLATLQDLLFKGADVDSVDKNGISALGYAVLGNQLKAAKVLIEAGATVDKVSNMAKTPLMFSISNANCTAMIHLLIYHGAEKQQALACAKRKGNLQAARLLHEPSPGEAATNHEAIIHWLKRR